MIECVGVGARIGAFMLADVTFALSRGQWGVVLGPAGAGKTTLLEIIAGVRRHSKGRIALRGADVTTRRPEARRLGMVYQHGFLFPHLDVEGNIAYGSSAAAACAAAERIGADALFGRSVATLSGGERQLVALARALATSPDILLLDEPFAALDPRRRSLVRSEVASIHRERGTTVLHVTHDFVEAGLLGDLAIVLHGGGVAQVATPDELFRKPASGIVADFVGIENVFRGMIESREGDTDGAETTLRFTGEGIELIGVGRPTCGPGHAVVRGEDVVLSLSPLDGSSPRNVLAGVVREIARDGVLSRVSVATGGTSITAVVTRRSVEELGLRPDVAVTASVKATAVHLC